MQLRALDEAVSGTGTYTLETRLFGGALITSDGTNAAVVVVRKNNASGDVIFQVSTKVSNFFVTFPILADAKIYYSISGTNGLAQLFEYVG